MNAECDRMAMSFMDVGRFRAVYRGGVNGIRSRSMLHSRNRESSFTFMEGVVSSFLIGVVLKNIALYSYSQGKGQMSKLIKIYYDLFVHLYNCSINSYTFLKI